MTRLGLRVTEFVRANPGLTLEEIARGVQARTAAVRDVLVGDGFSSSLRGSHPSDRAKVYSVVVETADGRGMVARPSQESRVAQVLLDGRWHTASDIHRRCGFMRLNSRIAALRKSRGWDIVCERIPGEKIGPNAYRYRLVGTSDDGGGDARGSGLIAPGSRLVNGVCDGASPPSSDAPVALQPARVGVSDSDVQLSLSEAA